MTAVKEWRGLRYDVPSGVELADLNERLGELADVSGGGSSGGGAGEGGAGGGGGGGGGGADEGGAGGGGGGGGAGEGGAGGGGGSGGGGGGGPSKPRLKFALNQTVSMDETPVWFEPAGKNTVDVSSIAVVVGRTLLPFFSTPFMFFRVVCTAYFSFSARETKTPPGGSLVPHGVHVPYFVKLIFCDERAQFL